MSVGKSHSGQGLIATNSGNKPELDLSIVVPVYNSAGTLNTLLERLSQVINLITPSYEIIVVDDGSRYGSWQVIQGLRETYGTHLVVVQLMRNYGQHNTLMCGLGLARGAYVVTMDDDLQNPPEEIPKLLAHIKQHRLDLVYGCPSARNHAAWRNVGSNIVWHFYRTVFRNSVTPTPFRIMRHQLAQSVMFYDLNFTYLDGLLVWCTSRIARETKRHRRRIQTTFGNLFDRYQYRQSPEPLHRFMPTLFPSNACFHI